MQCNMRVYSIFIVYLMYSANALDRETHKTSEKQCEKYEKKIKR